MANQFNLACPECGSTDNVTIVTIMAIKGTLRTDGVDYDCGGDFLWEDDNDAGCDECDWEGKVKDLITLKPGDEGYYEEGENDDGDDL